MKRSRRQFLKIGSLALGFIVFVGAGWQRVFAKPGTAKPPWAGVIKDSVVTCPVCGTGVRETMSSEAAKRVYHCPKCLAWLRPKEGDHCIYDSYGSVKCPTMQIKERRAKNLPI
jgi:anaerobic selenocysteine-containing dehydrogenase